MHNNWRIGHLQTKRTAVNVVGVRILVRSVRRLCVRMIADELNRDTVQQVLQRICELERWSVRNSWVSGIGKYWRNPLQKRVFRFRLKSLRFHFGYFPKPKNGLKWQRFADAQQYVTILLKGMLENKFQEWWNMSTMKLISHEVQGPLWRGQQPKVTR